mmetsp:Transcript_89655/g.231364  ORF Transcript_89655/g.231364 Transcript_89655/m.231364 type:complete len:238 (+) Transcript_89655:110-823(+)
MVEPCDNVFIGDLPAELDQPTLESVFGAYGNISQAKLLPSQGRCGALVRFASVDEATWVVENLNGNIPQGLTDAISVRYAPPLGDKGKGKGGKDFGKGFDKGGGGGKDRWSPYDNKGAPKGGGASIKTLKKGLAYAGVFPGGKWQNDEKTLYVGGLPTDTTDIDLYEIFSPFGAIPNRGVKAMAHEDGTSKGFGFVNFLTMESAQTAITTLNGTLMPDGTMLKVRSYIMGGKDGKGK